MKSILKHRYLHLTIGLVALFLMFYSPQFFYDKKINIPEFNHKLNEKEKIAEEVLNDLMEIKSPELLFTFSDRYAKINRDKGISFFILENNELIFWTNRDISFLNDIEKFSTPVGFVKLQNGWYQYLKEEKNRKTYLSLILVKYNYQINNKYFENKFHSSYGVACHDEIIEKETETSVYSREGDFLFALQQVKENDGQTSGNNWAVMALFFTAFIFLVSFISKQTRRILFIRRYSSIIVIAVILLIRFLLLYFNVFNSFMEMELFSPIIFAQSALLPSLGDLLVSAVFFSIFIYYLAKAIRDVNPESKLAVFVVAIICSLFPLGLADLLEGLIRNSKINFDINFLLDLNAYSFIGIGSIILILITLVLFIKISINHFIDKAFKRYQLITIYWILSLLSVIIGHFFINLSFFLTGWILLVILVFSFKTSPKTSFYRSAILILVIASTVSYGFIHIGKEKEQINKEFVAKKLAKERDPIAEYLFQDIVTKVKKDTLLNAKIGQYWDYKEEIDKHITNRYFGGYWSKYDVNIISPCRQNDSILIEPDNISVNCLSFFDEKIEREVENPFEIDETLNFLYSGEGISSYLAKIEVMSNDQTWYLFVELFPKVFSKTEGYPELLIDEKNLVSQINTNQYSYAKYKKGKLIYNLGKFNYSIELSNNIKPNSDGFFQTTFDNAYHVIYQNDKNSTIILSSPQKTIFNYITTFSYFFILTSLLVLIIGFVFKISPFNWQLALSDFSTKIQLFVIVSIFLSFILFGWGTTYYIKKQNIDKNKRLVAEKVQSVLIELEHKLGDKKELNSRLYDEMTYYLVKFSNVFYTDINLYDKSGRLLASSRPEIFERGFVSAQMNSKAYQAIHFFKKSKFTHTENIGGLNYISTYVPFRNGNNEILAYMNLPYFAKQNELENELSSFYTALVNVYGLLFLITAIIAVFFANYISEPVRLIKNKISALQLGKSSELLEWQSNDEIGALVLEYNKKVLELEKSAQLLVQSERESAWREMAKQVAHEIKNPLTPMKLSIQQLQRLAHDESVDLSDRIDRTSKTLIEQIDTLTKIANEFSNFAKMPKAHEERIDVVPIIETTIDLYHEEKPKIKLIDNSEGKAILVADKDQISRVFNNLIKNAIQAIPDTTEGLIEVEVVKDAEHVLIAIKDNGTGISDDKKDKIFVPNFTTKTTGMGLGLAMVKNIVEQANGTIWFDTKVGEGTTFYLKF